jgi:hypothetical protein
MTALATKNKDTACCGAPADTRKPACMETSAGKIMSDQRPGQALSNPTSHSTCK